jgi:hypothetical protein
MTVTLLVRTVVDRIPADKPSRDVAAASSRGRAEALSQAVP